MCRDVQQAVPSIATNINDKASIIIFFLEKIKNEL